MSDKHRSPPETPLSGTIASPVMFLNRSIVGDAIGAIGGAIGVVTGGDVTDATGWTTASTSVIWSEAWPFPPESGQPTPDQADLLGVLRDLVTEYAGSGGPPTALLRAVRDTYLETLPPSVPR